MRIINTDYYLLHAREIAMENKCEQIDMPYSAIKFETNIFCMFANYLQLFLECFWGNWKSESLTVVHLSALLTDIMHRRLSIFYESQLDALLHSKCKDQPVLKEQILI